MKCACRRKWTSGKKVGTSENGKLEYRDLDHDKSQLVYSTEGRPPVVVPLMLIGNVTNDSDTKIIHIRIDKPKRVLSFEFDDSVAFNSWYSVCYRAVQLKKKRKLEAEERKREVEISHKLETLGKKRTELLVVNDTLREIYERLGDTQLQDYFWNSHEVLINSMPENQHSAIPAVDVLQKIVKIEPKADGTREFRFNLTPPIISELFLQRPSLKQAYQTKVPVQMNEQEFWLSFVRAEFAHRYSSSNESSEWHPPIDHEKQRSIANATDPSIDLTSDETIFCISEDDERQEIRRRAHSSLLNECNSHSVQVSSTNSRSPAFGELGVELDFLNRPKSPFFVPLPSIDKALAPFTFGDASPAIQDNNVSVYHIVDGFKSKIEEGWSIGKWESLHSLFTPPSMIQDQDMTSAEYLDNSNKPDGFMKELSIQMDLARELQRHFWSCFPPQQSKLAKLKSVVSGIQKMRKEESEWRAQLNSLGYTSVVHYLNPLRDSLALPLSRLLQLKNM